jgi:hypothetical protein
MSYTSTWRNKWLTADAKSVEDMVRLLRQAAEELDQMRAAGVTLDPDGDTDSDYALMRTEDPDVARRFGFEEEEDEGEEEEEGEGQEEG